MERLAVIMHATHELYVIDVSDEVLARYGGEEEAYIEDTIPGTDEEPGYSWDYITAEWKLKDLN